MYESTRIKGKMARIKTKKTSSLYSGKGKDLARTAACGAWPSGCMRRVTARSTATCTAAKPVMPYRSSPRGRASSNSGKLRSVCHSPSSMASTSVGAQRSCPACRGGPC